MFRALVLAFLVISYPALALLEFGANGISLTKTYNLATFNALAVQPDGKIVAIGQSITTDGDYLLARFNTDGSPDLTFGTRGVAISSLGGDEAAYGLALQNDGKIVVVGSMRNA